MKKIISFLNVVVLFTCALFVTSPAQAVPSHLYGKVSNMKSIFTSIKLSLAVIVALFIPSIAQASYPMPVEDLCDKVVEVYWHFEEGDGKTDRMQEAEWAYKSVPGFDELPGPWQVNLASTAILIYQDYPNLRGDHDIERHYDNIHKTCMQKL